MNGELDETASQNSEDLAPTYPPPIPPSEESDQVPVTPEKQEPSSPLGSPAYDTPPCKMPGEKEEKVEVKADEEKEAENKEKEEEKEEEHEDSNLYEVPTSNKPVELPEGVLYQVCSDMLSPISVIMSTCHIQFRMLNWPSDVCSHRRETDNTLSQTHHNPPPPPSHFLRKWVCLLLYLRNWFLLFLKLVSRHFILQLFVFLL